MKVRDFKKFLEAVPEDAEVVVMDPETEDLAVDTAAYIPKDNKLAVITVDYDLNREDDELDAAIREDCGDGTACDITGTDGDPAYAPYNWENYHPLQLDDIPKDFRNNTDAKEA